MAITPGILQETRAQAAPPDASRAKARPARTPSVLQPWLRAQALNVTRHAAALRPFTRSEFGTHAAAPTEGHIQAVNELITSLRAELLKLTKKVGSAAEAAS